MTTPKQESPAGAAALDAGERDTLWIAVDADGIPDLATLHVDEADCHHVMDEIGLMGFTPRRCTLTIHKQESPADARDGEQS